MQLIEYIVVYTYISIHTTQRIVLCADLLRRLGYMVS